MLEMYQSVTDRSSHSPHIVPAAVSSMLRWTILVKEALLHVITDYESNLEQKEQNHLLNFKLNKQIILIKKQKF